ncbi:MAG: hypothetical protein HYZ37_02050 [Candidatus Solibacter usitatus]|nr:hypothetical protein [Candidatus Solibacter usitatus]
MRHAGSLFRERKTHIGQGREAARKTLIEKPELAEKIKESILAKKLALAEPPPAADKAK